VCLAVSALRFRDLQDEFSALHGLAFTLWRASHVILFSRPQASRYSIHVYIIYTIYIYIYIYIFTYHLYIDIYYIHIVLPAHTKMSRYFIRVACCTHKP